MYYVYANVTWFIHMQSWVVVMGHAWSWPGRVGPY